MTSTDAPDGKKSKIGSLIYLPVFASCFAFLAAFFFFKDGICCIVQMKLKRLFTRTTDVSEKKVFLSSKYALKRK